METKIHLDETIENNRRHFMTEINIKEAIASRTQACKI
jgi:hypothetical protein